MPVSASIYGGSRPRVAPITALDAMLEQAQRQDVRLKSQQNQQAFDDDQATRQASMASGGDQNKLLQLLQSGGQYKAAQALRKTMLDADKSRADIAGVGAKTKETLTDNQVKQIGIHTDMLSNVQNPDDAMQWAQIGKDSGALTEPQYQMALKNIQRVSQDPQAFNQWKNQAALGAKKYIEMNKPVFSTVNAGNAQVTTAREGLTGQVMPSLGQSTPILQSADNAASNARMAADAAASRGIQVRGQDLADARSRESNAAFMSKPFEVTGPDGTPVLVRQDKRGNITPVQGYGPKTGVEKPLTDAQSKAALFGSRMESSNKVLESLAGDGTTTSIPGARAGFGIGATLNTLSSAKQQQLNQAKRDFINAVLRRESGAVIADSEFNNAEQQYFPQVGDSPQVIKQKADNRALAIRGVQAEVPKASRGVLSEIQGGKPAASKVVNFGDLK